jgi:hypothetical protein
VGKFKVLVNTQKIYDVFLIDELLAFFRININDRAAGSVRNFTQHSNESPIEGCYATTIKEMYES